MDNQSAIYLLQDYAFSLYERGIEAREACSKLKENAPNSTEVYFYDGLAMGYYAALDSLINHTISFGLRDKIPGLDRFDPDRMLDSNRRLDS
jgi:hypothetical protein